VIFSQMCAAETDSSYVFVDGDSGEPLRKHTSPPRIAFTEEGVSKPSSRESRVESADPGEEGADIHDRPKSSRRGFTRTS